MTDARAKQIQGTRIGQSIATPHLVLHGLEFPHRVATRPQDWAEPARSYLFGRRRARV